MPPYYPMTKSMYRSELFVYIEHAIIKINWSEETSVIN